MRLLTKVVGYALLTGAVAVGAAKLSSNYTADKLGKSIDEAIVQPLKDKMAQRDAEFKDGLTTKNGEIARLKEELESTVKSLTELTSRPYQAHEHNGANCIVEQSTGKHFSFAKDARESMFFTGAELSDTLERLHSQYAASDFQKAYEEIGLKQKLEQYK